MIGFFIAGILHAGTVAVQVSASRQASVSDLNAMQRLKLSVYGVSVCAPESVEVPISQVMAALAVRGVPVEFPEFLPLIIARGQQESRLGRLRAAGEVGSGLASVMLAVTGAGPWWTAGAAGVALISRLAKGRQDEIIGILLPLATRLLRPGETLVPARGVCHAGLVLSKGDSWHVETSIQLAVPDAPIRVDQAPAGRWRPLPVAEIGWVAE